MTYRHNEQVIQKIYKSELLKLHKENLGTSVAQWSSKAGLMNETHDRKMRLQNS
jgi:hypothetical protein